MVESFEGIDGDKTKQLVVPNHIQEASGMCWATCGEIVMDTVEGGERIRQCRQATNALRRLDCCGDRGFVSDECAGEGWPDFYNWSFQCRTNTRVPLNWGEVMKEIDEKRAFAYAYSSGQGVTHMMVVKGYQVASGEKWLLCLNPVTGEDGIETTVSFEKYAAMNVRTHVKDYIGVERSKEDQ